MRFAIVSDTHFGDPMCALVDHETMQIGGKYQALVDNCGSDNDYLILLGDILDFSITDYETAYSAAQLFFRQIQKDKIAKSIIYIPGNHDFDLWHTVEYQINIIYQLSKGCPARRFKWSVPGFIEARTDRNETGFKLLGTIDTIIDPDADPEVPLFLNNITLQDSADSQPLNFYCAYPNLYVVHDSGCVLITHGHYLEAFWMLASEWIKRIAQEDLLLGDAYDLWEIVALNMPLCQLACSGIGQAGPLTTLVQKIQREAKDKELTRINNYIEKVDRIFDKLLAYSDLNPAEWCTDLVMNKLKGKLKDAIASRKTTQFREEFASNPEVLNRFRQYYNSSCVEISVLNEKYGCEIPCPDKVIFGHTHQPIKWDADNAPRANVPGQLPVRLYNTGGWLWRKHADNTKEFCGAEVFIFDQGKFSSKTIPPEIA